VKKILFIDNRRELLEGFYEQFSDRGEEWSVHFAVDSAKGVAILENYEIDIVVSGLFMGYNSEVQFLDFLAQKYPEIVRIGIGTGNSENDDRVPQNGHRNFSLPLDIKTLEATIERVYYLPGFLKLDNAKKVIASLTSLPNIPPIYAALLEQIENRDIPSEAVKEVFSNHSQVGTMVLQIINSSLFGATQEIKTPREAVAFVGAEIVMSLVLMIELFREFKPENELFSSSLLAEHSLITANLTKTILEAEGVPKILVDETFSAAILHDVGELILSCSFPQKYSSILTISTANDEPLIDVEMKNLGTNHAEVGAYLLGLWGLPEEIVEAIAFHHTPLLSDGESSNMLCTLHVANNFSYEFVPEFIHSGFEGTSNSFLSEMGISDRWYSWRELCQNKLKEIEYI
jgi:putative nucleotidyltransferase with HDIG domain